MQHKSTKQIAKLYVICYFYGKLNNDFNTLSMRKPIKVTCENTNVVKEYPFGISLNEIIEDQRIKLKFPILGALVNNKLEELSYNLSRPKHIRFIDITHPDGLRMYARSLTFVLHKTVKEKYPDARFRLEHSISGGYYCELGNLGEAFTFDTVFALGERMREIIEANIPFEREEITVKEAIGIFENSNFTNKAKLFKTLPRLYTSVYRLNGMTDYYYGYLVPSTGYLEVFDLIKYYDGMLLLMPKHDKPEEVSELIEQPKLFEIFQEHKRWGTILDIATVGSVNEKVMNGETGDMIKVSEALHEKKVSQIADQICSRPVLPRVVLISGPSSSGKTTFTKRLGIQLKVSGIKPVEISLDNYFVDRESTPLDDEGHYDFESLEALDVAQFNKDLIDLLDGKEVEMPKFGFDTGKRYYDGTKLQITEKQIILIEGIHALNPKLTPLIEVEMKFKVYVSALTQIGIDGYNRIPTTDNRLLRRIIRDHQYRNYPPVETIRRWASVRRGEHKHIFPFQEEADVMFNSALAFELGVLKYYIEPLLLEISESEPEFTEARRLLKLLSYFKPITDEEIPPTSLLREFLSHSSFKY